MTDPPTATDPPTPPAAATPPRSPFEVTQVLDPGGWRGLPWADVLEHLLRSTDEMISLLDMAVDPPVVTAASLAVQRFVQQATVGRAYGHGRPEIVQQVMIDCARRAQQTGAHEFTGQYRSGGIEISALQRYAAVGTGRRYVVVHTVDLAAATSAGVGTAVLETLLAAAAAERRHLARELHDDAVQVLAALAIRLEPLAARDDLVGELGRTTQTELRHLAVRLRAVLADLDPATLTPASVGAAIHERARGEAERADVEVQVFDAVDGAAPPEVIEALYRIGTEAVLNAIRHAAAKRIRVHVETHRSGWGLRVRDDGRGFQPDAVPSGRYGLVSMRARARHLGGSVAVTSVPGEGTIVQVWLPDEPRRSASPDDRALTETAAAVQRVHTEHQQAWAASPVAQLLCDPHGTIVRVNPAAEGLLARRASTLIGRHARSLAAPGDRDAFTDAVESVQEGFEASVTGTVALARRDAGPARATYHVHTIRDGMEPPWSTLLTLLAEPGTAPRATA